jgi:triosephosphate isomerase (TIM)
MSRKKIVAGNWKMNTNWDEALLLVEELIPLIEKNDEVEKIIFPPAIFIQGLLNFLKSNPHPIFKFGIQNFSQYAKGAYTGEISASMIKSIGCHYVLIGHSEPRMYFNESTEQLVSKINEALGNDLKIIFCFGEQLTERKNNFHFETVKSQLESVLDSFPIEKINQLTLAYEPVWAIGTGETASPKQAQEMHQFIRKTTSTIFSEEIANELCILYGGSCNEKNAKELFACPDVDGGLIGGASLNAIGFSNIIHSF